MAQPTTQQARGGQSDSYFAGDGAQQAPYSAQPPMQEGYQEPKYPQQPPSYGQNYGPPTSVPAGGEKTTFEQTFKLQKPKYNDIWAGILV